MTCGMSQLATWEENERRGNARLCEPCRQACTQTWAHTNKPKLAKNNREGDRCFQLKCRLLLKKPRSHIVWVLGGRRLLEGTTYGNLFALSHVPDAMEDTASTLQLTHWLFLGCSTWMQGENRKSWNRLWLFPLGLTGNTRTREYYAADLSASVSPCHSLLKESQFTWVTGSLCLNL